MSQTVISALVLALVLDLDLHLAALAVLQDGGVATRFDVHDLVPLVGAFHAGADVLAVVTLAGGTLHHVGNAVEAITTGRGAGGRAVVGAGEGLVVHGRLLLGLLHLGGQLLVMGLLRPLHAIDGTVEAFGREAGTGLGF